MNSFVNLVIQPKPASRGDVVSSMSLPYKGSAAAHPDLMSGQTQVMFDTLAAVQGHMKTGALKPLAVTTAKRVPGVDLPTMAEAGLPGYETTTWGGILAPAGTPKDVVAKLNAEFNKDLAQADIRKKISDAGIEVAGGTPQQFSDFIQSEMKKWAKVAKDANIQPE